MGRRESALRKRMIVLRSLRKGYKIAQAPGLTIATCLIGHFEGVTVLRGRTSLATPRPISVIRRSILAEQSSGSPASGIHTASCLIVLLLANHGARAPIRVLRRTQ